MKYWYYYYNRRQSFARQLVLSVVKGAAGTAGEVLAIAGERTRRSPSRLWRALSPLLHNPSVVLSGFALGPDPYDSTTTALDEIDRAVGLGIFGNNR